MQGRTPLLETLRELECEIRLLTVYARECCGCYEILRRKLDRLSGLIGEDCSRAQWQADSDDPALQRSACACATRRCRPSANWRSTFARACCMNPARWAATWVACWNPSAANSTAPG